MTMGQDQSNEQEMGPEVEASRRDFLKGIGAALGGAAFGNLARGWVPVEASEEPAAPAAPAQRLRRRMADLDPTGPAPEGPHGEPAGRPYVTPLVAFGQGPFVWKEVSDIPAWQQLDPSGVLFGLPENPSTNTMALQFTDSAGATAQVTVAETVTPAEPLTVYAEPEAAAPGQTVQVTAVLRDATSARVPNAPIRFVATGSATLSGANGGALPTATDANGSAGVTLGDTQAETVVVSAAANGQAGSTSVIFTTSPAVPTYFGVDVPPPGQPAAGTNGIAIIARVLDQHRLSIAGVPVLFETTLGTLSAASVMTDAFGQAETILTSDQPGTAAVTVTVPGISEQNTIDRNLTIITFTP
jgi:hypothetical protein